MNMFGECQVGNMVAARQMDFIGKVICTPPPPDHPVEQMLTACCSNIFARWDACSSTTRITSSRTYTSSLPVYLKSQSTPLAPSRAGSVKLSTNSTGCSLSNASSTHIPHYRPVPTTDHDHNKGRETMVPHHGENSHSLPTTPRAQQSGQL